MITKVLLGILLIGIVFAGTMGWVYVKDYRNLVVENTHLKATVEKYDGRLASYRRMIDRRDAAINASQCKNQITRWLRHPDEIPGMHDQFRHPLDINTTGQPNAIDTEPVPEFKWPWNLW